MCGKIVQVDQTSCQARLRHRNALLAWCLDVTRNGGIAFALGYPLLYPHKMRLINQSVFLGQPDEVTREKVSFEVQGDLWFPQTDVGILLKDLTSLSLRAQTESKLCGAGDKITNFGDRAKITQRFSVVTARPQPCNEWLVQVAARTAAKIPGPLTRYAAAYHVAVCVKKAFDECGGVWRLEDGTRVVFDDVVLLELVKVGKGSWQVILAYLEREN